MAICTEGIRIFNRPFVLPYQGRKVAVLLMDTQGAWDGRMTKEQNAAIFGLTALLASRLIVNTQNMLSDDKIDAIDFFTTFAQNAVTGLVTDGTAPFGHLEFLIRDWAWFESGWDIKQCKGMMEEHLSGLMNPDVEGRKETSDRLKAIFHSMSCSGLPHPGLGVTRPQFQGEFKDISNDFFQALDEFTRSFFNVDEFPRPSAPLGNEISPATFANTIQNFAQAFTDNKGSAIYLREAFVKVELFKTRDLIVDHFKKMLGALAPEGSVVDPDRIDEAEGKMKDLIKNFVAKIKPFKMDDEAKHVAELEATLSELLVRRRQQNAAELDAAQMKLFIYTPAAGGGLYFFGSFLTGHPVLDTMTLGGFAYIQAKKKAKILNKDSPVDGEVVKALMADARTFSSKRRKDAQAMSIAAQKCTPDVALSKAKVLTRDAVASAASAGTTMQRTVTGGGGARELGKKQR